MKGLEVFSKILLFGLLAASLRTVEGTQSAATIIGVVIDNATNEPLADVQVSLYPSEPPVYERPTDALRPPPLARTDVEGRFSLKTDQTGRFRIVPAKNGFVPYNPHQSVSALPGIWIQISANSRLDPIELRMAQPAAISGRVLDPDGKPNIKGIASLRRYTYGTEGIYSLRPYLLVSSGRLDDRGEFRIFDVPPGEYYLGIGDGGSYPNLLITQGQLFYYPGMTTDETKAAPIRVRGGEDVRLGTLQLPLRNSDVSMKIRLMSPVPKIHGDITIGDTTFSAESPSDFFEKSVRIQPGRYQLVVTSYSATTSDYYYASLSVDVESSDIALDIPLKRTPAVTGTIMVETAKGERKIAPSKILCKLDGRPSLNCSASRPLPGPYELTFQGLSPDMYVLSAKANGRDILAEGFNLADDAALEIVLAEPGAVLLGTVRSSAGDLLPDASVVVVPNEPYRSTGVRYRAVVTDPNGKFEIRGVAPGSYKVFAWAELEGAAYKNVEFIKQFEERAKAMDMQTASPHIVDLVAF